MLLGTALLASSAVHALTQPRWEDLVSGTGAVPDADGTLSYSEWFDALNADASNEHLGSGEVVVCGACADSAWTVVYRLTLPSASQILTQFRTRPAVETGTVASWIGGQVYVDGIPPSLSPATIRQDAPDSPALVEVRGRWRLSPRAPVDVTYDRDVGGRPYPADIALEIGTGAGWLVTEVTGARPTTQAAHRVTLDSAGRIFFAVTLVAPHEVGPDVEDAPMRSATRWLQWTVQPLWVGLVALAPLAVVLALFAYARPRLGRSAHTGPLHAAAAAGVVVAAAATVATSTTWSLSELFRLLQSRIPGAETGPWFFSYGIGYGAALVLAAVGLHHVAIYVGQLSEPGQAAPLRAASTRTGWSALAATGVAVLATAWAVAALSDHAPDYLEQTVVSTMPTVVTVCIVIPVAMAGAAAAALGRAAALPGAAVGAWLGLLAVTMPWTAFTGGTPTAVRYAAVGALVFVALFAVARIGVVLYSGRRLKHHGRAKTVLAVIVVVAATPFPAAATAYRSGGVGWDDAWSVTRVLAMVLPVVVSLGVLAAARDLLGRKSSARSGPRLRLLAVATGGLLLFSSTALTAYLPVAYGTALALLWWFTLPGRRSSTVSLMTVPEAGVRPELTSRLVTVREAERVAARLRRGFDSKVESGDKTWAERQTAVRAVVESADAARQGAPTNGLDLETAALGTYPRAPWRWAGHTTVIALIAGLPWIALSIPGLLEFAGPRGYGPLTTVLAALLTAIRWPALGLLFGLAYPLLRGRTGVTKSLTLFVTVAIPSAVTLLLQSTEPGAWRSFLYLASQQLIVCLILGVATEAEILRLAGRSLSDVTTVHNVRAIVAWVSGLVAAVAAAATTALATGVTALVVGILAPQGIQDPSPPAQPSDSSPVSTSSPAPEP
ncbi:hypothetical protein [Cellulomonas palmilytica]|uniref:hypothetical protein n=1 Tax=Cellulomonas palmilytica TaxID=2608402 RepID=UPI001F197AA1|nr:hypothetical protein [Cellulomonas palmilytica]UJP40294.1 hypothetical protein F1D97_01775 [Cellulomonas palmilytica]